MLEPERNQTLSVLTVVQTSVSYGHLTNAAAIRFLIKAFLYFSRVQLLTSVSIKQATVA